MNGSSLPYRECWKNTGYAPIRHLLRGYRSGNNKKIKDITGVPGTRLIYYRYFFLFADRTAISDPRIPRAATAITPDPGDLWVLAGIGV